MNTYTQVWDQWAPLAARLLFATQFAIAVFFKLTMFSMQVAQTAAAGVPLATIAVALALILEMIGVVALVSGYYIRLVAALLAGYVMLLALIFYHGWSDPMVFGSFVSHLGLTAGLMYVSVFGARK